MSRLSKLLLIITAVLVLAVAVLAAFGASSATEQSKSFFYFSRMHIAINILCALTLASLAGHTAALAHARRRKEAALTRRLSPLAHPQQEKHKNNKFENIDAFFDSIIVNNSKNRDHVSQLTSNLEQARNDHSKAKQAVSTIRKQEEKARSRSLGNASRTMAEAITHIQSAAKNLQTATSNAGRAAREQTRLSGETATAMTQMNASVAQVAESAEYAAVAADKAMEQAGEGENIVRESVKAILEVNRRTGELSGVVAGLGEQAQGIGRIMNVIADIADQTNLLALNAAIEAARAGDAGRGFAVVADEVRKLAEKTMEATRDVTAQIEAIQNGVRRTGEGMAEASAMVEKATTVTRRSGAMLAEIVELSRDNADQIRSIAAAATQQSTASEQITRAVAEVDDISRNTDTDMQNSGDAMGVLLSGLSELNDLNGAFELMGTGRVQKIIAALAESADIRSMEPDRQHAALRRAVHKSLELAYLTDARGIQPIDNVPRPGKESAADALAKDKNWSSRPWFTEAMETNTLSISRVYISKATGQRCITVSSPFTDDKETPLGVIAADVTLK